MKDKRKVFILLFLLVFTSIIATVEVIGAFIVEIPSVRADRAGAILLIVNWLFTCFFCLCRAVITIMIIVVDVMPYTALSYFG